jgi:hypothetical protein
MVDVATREQDAPVQRVADAGRASSVDTIEEIFYG